MSAVAKNLGEFVERLEEKGDLVRIQAQVSRDLEITEIADRVMKGPPEGNKALLFENVEGFSIPVLINLFGSEARMASALEASNLEELARRLASLFDMQVPNGLRGVIARGADILTAVRAMGLVPSLVRKAACQEVVIRDHPDVNILPILKCWPHDAGRFITLPQVVTIDPVSGTRNVGMYRIQVLDRDRLIVHWQRHKDGAGHGTAALESGRSKVPAAVVLGGPPAAIWAASAPLPPGIDEYMLAGWIRRKPLELTQCVTQPLQVPANAEVVIEGYVDLENQVVEGPFGDHTGYYTPPEPFPVLHVTAVTHCASPIYPATIVGVPPMEDTYMGKATERLFLPLIRLVLPEVVDIHLPPAGVFHNLVIVKIRKRFPGHARKVIHALWGTGLMMLAKAVVVVDEWVDVHNLYEVAWQALGNVDWIRDSVITEGPVDHLDHASAGRLMGGKIGVDATAKLPEEGHDRGWPEVVRMSREIKMKVDKKWKELGLEA